MNERASSLVRTEQGAGASECAGGAALGAGGAAEMGSAVGISLVLFDFDCFVIFGRALTFVAIGLTFNAAPVKFSARLAACL